MDGGRIKGGSCQPPGPARPAQPEGGVKEVLPQGQPPAGLNVKAHLKGAPPRERPPADPQRSALRAQAMRASIVPGAAQPKAGSGVGAAVTDGKPQLQRQPGMAVAPARPLPAPRDDGLDDLEQGTGHAKAPDWSVESDQRWEAEKAQGPGQRSAAADLDALGPDPDLAG